MKGISINGTKIDNAKLADVMANISIWIERRDSGKYLCLSNVHMLVESWDDEELFESMEKAALVLCDGKPLALTQRFKGNCDVEHIRGLDLTNTVLQKAAENNWSIGFLGGAPEVLERLITNITEEFKGLNVSYSCSPPYRELTKNEVDQYVYDIRVSEVDFLFVGLGCPKQEKLMRMLSTYSDVPVMAGVGAVFDFKAGNVQAAPEWVVAMSLEWLYRLSREPRRLFGRYLKTNSRFLYEVVFKWKKTVKILG